MEQKPSIGRIVHFKRGDVACAAIVTRVWSDTMVNLTVFDPDGGPDVKFTSSRYGTGDTEWSWPPRV
jgi:hypothetical protein